MQNLGGSGVFCTTRMDNRCKTVVIKKPRFNGEKGLQWFGGALGFGKCRSPLEASLVSNDRQRVLTWSFRSPPGLALASNALLAEVWVTTMPLLMPSSSALMKAKSVPIGPVPQSESSFLDVMQLFVTVVKQVLQFSVIVASVSSSACGSVQKDLLKAT